MNTLISNADSDGSMNFKTKKFGIYVQHIVSTFKKIDIYIRHPKPTSRFNFAAVCLELCCNLFSTSCYGLVLLFDFVELVSLSYFDFTTVFSHE